MSYHWRLVNVVPLVIGECRVGGPTLKIRDCLTTPLFRNPVAIVLIQQELRSSISRWPIAPKSVSYEQNIQHIISDNYILELTLYTMNGEVN